MKHHIIKFLAALTLSAMLLTGCGNKAAESKPYEPEGSMGLEELAAIAQDTVHYRAIIFISPYCYGCRQSMSYTLPAVEAMDTALANDKEIGAKAAAYVQSEIGATEKIYKEIFG